jgi:L-ascorbate metabolism protein UlaG (beta-lactamase superfamily)
VNHRLRLITFALALALAAARASAEQPPARGKVSLTWLGHAAFELVSRDGTRVLIDPWVSGNDQAPAAFKDFARYLRDRPAAILVTHAHGDHADDAPALARITAAKVLATGEHLRAMKIADEQQLSMNVGGSVQIGDLTIFAVPAMHSSDPGGRPLGYVIAPAGGPTIYHSGDTAIFGDMALIEELYRPRVLLLACGGGRWGMDPRAAALAARKYFHAETIVPMHFGTFAPLAVKADVERAFAGNKALRFMAPGETISW